MTTFNVTAQENSSLVITELMPNPSGADDTGEWLEIYNASSTNQNLNAWRLEGSTLEDITILPQEHLIIARSPVTLQNSYTDLTARIVPGSFVLLNSGDTIELTNSATNEKSVFVYTQAEEGKSFELLKGDCQVVQKNILGNSIGKDNNSCAIFLTPTATLSPVPSIQKITATPSPTENKVINSQSTKNIREQIKLAVPRIYRL
ncbi:MAG TPA: lamin tail domain-containing protein [Candidatus Dojkabacteria bacterium]|nr:lamin tail domain-containing protein [Candidatus Dojkabacteria bacterium]